MAAQGQPVAQPQVVDARIPAIAPLRLPQPDKFIPENQRELASEWLESLTLYFDAMHINDPGRIPITLTLLGGSAASWVNSNPRQREWLNALDWDTFCEEFTTQFEPINRERYQRDELEKLRLGNNQDIVSYCQKFRQARTRCKNLSNAEAYRIFESSLPKGMQYDLRMRTELDGDFEGALAFIQGIGGVTSQLTGGCGYNPFQKTQGRGHGRNRGRGKPQTNPLEGDERVGTSGDISGSADAQSSVQGGGGKRGRFTVQGN
ncbi:MAG: hypothetical protein Aurels2KO_58270 [Aureliella sp.]